MKNDGREHLGEHLLPMNIWRKKGFLQIFNQFGNHLISMSFILCRGDQSLSVQSSMFTLRWVPLSESVQVLLILAGTHYLFVETTYIIDA